MHFLLFAAAAAVTVNDCAIGKSAFTLSSLSIYPMTPIGGDTVTLYMDYTVPTGMTVTGGTATTSVKYNFINLQPTTEPLCSNIPCPLTAGSYSNTTKSVWPSGLSGSVKSRLTWENEEKTLLACIEISGKL
jgi:hypothetical protein